MSNTALSGRGQTDGRNTIGLERSPKHVGPSCNWPGPDGPNNTSARKLANMIVGLHTNFASSLLAAAKTFLALRNVSLSSTPECLTGGTSAAGTLDTVSEMQNKRGQVETVARVSRVAVCCCRA